VEVHVAISNARQCPLVCQRVRPAAPAVVYTEALLMNALQRCYRGVSQSSNVPEAGPSLTILLLEQGGPFRAA